VALGQNHIFSIHWLEQEIITLIHINCIPDITGTYYVKLILNLTLSCFISGVSFSTLMLKRTENILLQS
jgi:hypothetical protein